MRRFLMIIIGALLLQGAYSQTTERPKWTDGYFEEVQNSYVEVVSAVGYEPDNARKKAMQQVLERRSMASGTQATVSMTGNDVQVKSEHDLIAKARVVDEYVERIEAGQYRVYLLVQTAKNPSLSFEPITLSEKYPFSGRVFVPGMAQIHKGTKAKGGIIIGAEALGVAGIVTSFSMKATNEKLMYQDPKHMAAYDSRANMWQNIGYGCIAFTAAVYIYNIIDGIVAPGKKHIQIGKNSYDMAVAPLVTTCGDFGLAMQVKF